MFKKIAIVAITIFAAYVLAINIGRFIDSTVGIDEIDGVRNQSGKVLVTGEFDNFSNMWDTHVYEYAGFGRYKMRNGGGSYPADKGMIYAFEQTWYNIQQYPLR